MIELNSEEFLILFRTLCNVEGALVGKDNYLDIHELVMDSLELLKIKIIGNK